MDYKLPFNGSSSYKDEFIKHPFTDQFKTQLRDNQRVPQINGGKIGDSTYANSYKRHNISNYEKSPCPVVELPQRPNMLSPG